MEVITPETPIASQKIQELYTHWRSLQTDDVAPLWSGFDVLDVFSIMPNTMMVDLEEDPFRVKYRFVGTQVVRYTGFEFTGKYLDEIVLDDHSAPFHEAYKRAATEQRPILEWCDWSLEDGIVTSYDFAIFPFIGPSGAADIAVSIECYDRMQKDFNSIERTLRQPQD